MGRSEDPFALGSLFVLLSEPCLFPGGEKAFPEFKFASLSACHGLRWTPVTSPPARLWRGRRCWLRCALKLSPITSTASYGAISSFRGLRLPLRPTDFLVYASCMSFRRLRPFPASGQIRSGFCSFRLTWLCMQHSVVPPWLMVWNVRTFTGQEAPRFARRTNAWRQQRRATEPSFGTSAFAASAGL